MTYRHRSGINREPYWSCREQGGTPRTHCGPTGEWTAKRSRRIKARLNALCGLSRPAPSEYCNRGPKYEEASQRRSDYCFARVCRACFGTAYGSEPDCKPRHRPGCFSSRGVRSFFSAPQSERGICWSARRPPILNVWLWSGCSKSWPYSTKPPVSRPVANSGCAPPRSQTGSSAPSSPSGVRSVLAGGSMNDRHP